MRNEHPFDSGLSAVIITLENEVDDQTPSEEAPYTKRRSVHLQECRWKEKSTWS